jgi:hypothetical protein
MIMDKITDVFLNSVLLADKSKVRETIANLQALEFLSDQYELREKLLRFYIDQPDCS